MPPITSQILSSSTGDDDATGKKVREVADMNDECYINMGITLDKLYSKKRKTID